MESYGSVDASQAAADELARLNAIEDETWFSQDCDPLPLGVRIGILVVGVVGLTAWGIWISRDNSAIPLMVGVFGVLGYIAVVTRLEKRHYGVSRPLRMPRRAWPQAFRLMVGPNIAIMIMVPAFLAATELGAPWWVIGAIVTAGMVGAVAAGLVTAAVSGRTGSKSPSPTTPT